VALWPRHSKSSLEVRRERLQPLVAPQLPLSMNVICCRLLTFVYLAEASLSDARALILTGIMSSSPARVALLRPRLEVVVRAWF